jgi:hypothetical protein
MSDDASPIRTDETLEHADVEVLRLARREARFVLDHQLDGLDRLAERTMWTLRFSLVVLGVAVSAAALGVVGWLVNPFTVAGVTCLSASVVVGLASVGSGHPTVGIGSDHVEECLSESYSEAEWLTLLLANYRDWMAETATKNEVYAKLFGVTHALTGLGVVLLAVGWVSAIFAGS